MVNVGLNDQVCTGFPGLPRLVQWGSRPLRGAARGPGTARVLAPPLVPCPFPKDSQSSADEGLGMCPRVWKVSVRDI
jgi:hypothetical protein